MAIVITNPALTKIEINRFRPNSSSVDIKYGIYLTRTIHDFVL